MNFNLKLLCFAGALTVLVEPASASQNQTLLPKFKINNENDFNNLIVYKSWEATALEQIEDIANKDKWIARPKYKISILEVISKAIADCVTKKNEFGKFCSAYNNQLVNIAKNKQGAPDTWDEWVAFEKQFVTFDASPKNMDYTWENWNAFILYNYLNYKINYNGSLFGINPDDNEAEWLIDHIVTNTLASYLQDLDLSDEKKDRAAQLIKRAASDIKQYVEQLNLENYLSELIKAKITSELSKLPLTPPKIERPRNGRLVSTRNGIVQSGYFIVERADKRQIMQLNTISTKCFVINGQVYEKPADDYDYDLFDEPQNNIINHTQLSKLNVPVPTGYTSNRLTPVNKYMQQNANINRGEPSVYNKNVINPPAGGRPIQNVQAITTMPMKNNQGNMQFMNNNIQQNFNNLNINSQGNLNNNIQNQNITMQQGNNYNNNVNNQNNNFNYNNNVNNQNNNFNYNNNVNNQNNNFNYNNNVNNQNNNFNNIVPNNNFQNLNNNLYNNFNNSFVSNNNFYQGFQNQQNIQMNMPNNFQMQQEMNQNFWQNTNTLIKLQISTELRDSNSIHNLLHSAKYTNGATCQSTISKCYFNSTMQCMANVNVLYQAIRISYERQPKGNTAACNLISAFYAFVTACRNGDMDNKPNDLNSSIEKYDAAIRLLHFAKLDYDAIDMAQLFMLSNPGHSADFWQSLAEQKQRQLNTVDPYRDHLLSDFFDFGGGVKSDGCNPVQLLNELLPYLQEQMECCGIYPPTKPQYCISSINRPFNARQKKGEDIQDPATRQAVVNETFGNISLPSGISSLSDFLQTPQATLKINQLPQVLIYTYIGKDLGVGNKNEYHTIELPQIITLQDSQGTKLYRLNSFVAAVTKTGGHYMPIMLTNQGWFTINDANHDECATSALNYKETKYYDPDTGSAYNPALIFYEQIG